jgi:hypothetical protein
MSTTPTDPWPAVPDDALGSLYQGRLEEFTAKRNELAKSLRSDGEAEAADWVKRLQKPTRAAWLVNQLSVRKRKEIARLLEAGKQLRAAQEEMLAGAADRAKLREAAQREQQTIDSLVRTAEAYGREHGVGAQILTRVGETLQAASSDPQVAEAIERGRITREQRAASIGLVGSATPAAPRSKGARAKQREETERRARRELAKRRQAAERKLAAAEKRFERERSKLERAREAVEEVEGRVHEAQRDVHAARRGLDEI